ncbi:MULTISPECIES: hypothetical protein [unclassified Tolypothrix]|nr:MULTISPECIES: hypothetical protein [unclassified Tolypothrix]EKF05660.1 hypothetical protein FDUTEX481_00515 [Tolypothrix sp. PCC 7601]BAY92581.1 hypothetical protein NIES3275_46170 [Microchaete diplosiphon NIES-3275]
MTHIDTDITSNRTATTSSLTYLVTVNEKLHPQGDGVFGHGE